MKNHQKWKATMKIINKILILNLLNQVPRKGIKKMLLRILLKPLDLIFKLGEKSKKFANMPNYNPKKLTNLDKIGWILKERTTITIN